MPPDPEAPSVMEKVLSHTVAAEQIDHLGHMNVLFYADLARRGATAMAATLTGAAGAGGPGSGGPVWLPDQYVRHHHEQLEGAPLTVSAGVLDADPHRIRLYEELTNDATGELAAAFVVHVAVTEGDDHRPAVLPDAVVAKALARRVSVPDHGRPRSIGVDDDPGVGAPSLAELGRRDLALRRERVLSGSECEEAGWCRTELLMDLVWGGVPLEGRAFQPFHTAVDGTVVAFATMETRATWVRRPRQGARLQSFGAEVELGAKTIRGRHWVYDLDTAELAGVFSEVALAFAFDARRALVIPDEIRAELSTHLHPDLG